MSQGVNRPQGAVDIRGPRPPLASCSRLIVCGTLHTKTTSQGEGCPQFLALAFEEQCSVQGVRAQGGAAKRYVSVLETVERRVRRLHENLHKALAMTLVL